MKLLHFITKLFHSESKYNPALHTHSESAIRYAADTKESNYLFDENVMSIKAKKAFDEHFEKHIDFYAERHPVMVVRQIASRLREKSIAVDQLNATMGVELSKYRETISRLEAELYAANMQIEKMEVSRC